MKRRIHVYGLGTGKSGTTSMAGIFSSYYRAVHEPHPKEYMAVITALIRGRISKEDFRRYTLYMDSKLELEFNSSFLNTWLLEVLIAEYPEAKFIFTIRDCYSWLDSVIIRLVSPHSQIPDEYRRFMKIMFQKDSYPSPREEQDLFRATGYTLDGLLSYWAKTNNEILSIVPSHRILVIKTQEIKDRSAEIAHFLDIAPETLDLTNSFMNKNMENPRIISKIDKDYLSGKVNVHCQTLMDRFFPGFQYTVD